MHILYISKPWKNSRQSGRKSTCVGVSFFHFFSVSVLTHIQVTAVIANIN